MGSAIGSEFGPAVPFATNVVRHIGSPEHAVQPADSRTSSYVRVCAYTAVPLLAPGAGDRGSV